MSVLPPQSQLKKIDAKVCKGPKVDLGSTSASGTFLGLRLVTATGY